MKAVRFWLVAVAVICFAAGISVGLAASRLGLGEVEAAETSDPDEDFIRQLTDLCSLDAQQVRLLRMVLASHEAELREIARRYYDQFPARYRRESSTAGSRMDMRILTMLTADQRKTYQATNRPEQK